ncbi:gamma carbonic anhydrase family protein [Aestuariibacter sp. AA17]|uniref:Gamma carbonic anhydrase family protein n=1 Tax=Fluctibacter corallii TaxID=2984329 RepID=A0ABT3A643_9ALTE|nr:gamma carbonic anhydrase family protein [Aestuariibacter sp. AA17]MCV2884134.1 gamma carbonic anhydrase family protein [Aestuariibacter sp. AA17]
MRYQLGEQAPSIDESVFVAPGSHIIGDVVVHKGASIWFNVVIRGDCHTIEIHENTNIQDGAVLHTDEGVPLVIKQGVTVGHKAVLHGCIIDEFSLIGINAVILNGAKIGKHCLIGANSLITENMTIPDGAVVMGSPGKIVKYLDDKQKSMLEMSSEHYVKNAQRFMQSLDVLTDN